MKPELRPMNEKIMMLKSMKPPFQGDHKWSKEYLLGWNDCVESIMPLIKALENGELSDRAWDVISRATTVAYVYYSEKSRDENQEDFQGTMTELNIVLDKFYDAVDEEIKPDESK